MKPRILLIDDEQVFSQALKITLARRGMQVRIADSPEQGIKAYLEFKMDFDVVLIDYHFRDTSITGSEIALKIKSLNKNQVIIFMTGYQETNFLDSMLETGVGRTFIRKGQDIEPLALINPILNVVNEIVKVQFTPETEEDELRRISEINSLGIAGKSIELYKVVQTINRVKKYKSQFMIIGSTGVGKEAIAQAFKIPGKLFFSVNCARFASGGDQFLESELFGHKKGAYTGADTDQVGLFERVKDGVIFLDELHHLSLGAQARLLRAIQELKFRRLGDTSGSEKNIEATIVSATKPEIYSMMDSGAFMPDLFFRLAKTEIVIPSLCDRKSDIRPLCDFLSNKIGNRLSIKIEFAPGLIREMENYDWPGNVRELSGFIEGAAMASVSNGIIGIEDFKEYVSKKTKRLEILDDNPMATNLNYIVDSVESERIISVLKKSAAVKIAANTLGIARSTLIGRMKRLGIDPKKFLNWNQGSIPQKGK